MKIGITRFPGTNCDYDIWSFVQELGHQPVWLWHDNNFEISDIDAVVIPGGFSYGDYLRCGALAAKSSVMNSVRQFSDFGGPVLGICNGFQILCESGLLPGVLMKNESLHFQDEWVDLKVQNVNPYFGKSLTSTAQLHLPIAHGEGRFFADSDSFKKIEDQGQIWLSYSQNPNGSLGDIAGITNQKKNVAGLMPHPERALWDWAGGVDGRSFL